jgi:hypothetical protein
MRITTNYTYPNVAERNKTIHVPRSVAEVAIYMGQATLAPRAAYGTPEFLAERAEAAKNAIPDKHDTVGTPVVGTEWSVWTEPRTGRQLLLRKQGYETFRFETAQKALDHGCPPSIAKKFIPEDARQSAREQAQEKSEQAHIAAEQQEKKDNARAKASMWK